MLRVATSPCQVATPVGLTPMRRWRRAKRSRRGRDEGSSGFPFLAPRQQHARDPSPGGPEHARPILRLRQGGRLGRMTRRRSFSPLCGPKLLSLSEKSRAWYWALWAKWSGQGHRPQYPTQLKGCVRPPHDLKTGQLGGREAWSVRKGAVR